MENGCMVEQNILKDFNIHVLDLLQFEERGWSHWAASCLESTSISKSRRIPVLGYESGGRGTVLMENPQTEFSEKFFQVHLLWKPLQGVVKASMVGSTV
jgi:hypothetical protein